MLRVEKTGLYTTVQDLGRFGYLAHGVPTSGALDFRSHMLVNAILGNDFKCATIEMTYVGAHFKVLATNYIAALGADMDFRVNDVEMPLGKVIKVTVDDDITFKTATKGMRTYLGIAGGFQTEKILNSRSTHETIQFGSRLNSGDIINSEHSHIPSENKRIKTIEQDIDIRVVPGQQYEYFSKTELNKFLNEPYKISSKSDRMGFRLVGEKLHSEQGYDIVSEPTLLGSIQVPADGMPIVLLNERQTVGGYPKIATVIKADIPKLAQLQPNESVTFKLVELDQAKKLYKNMMEQLYNNEFIEDVNIAKHIDTEKINKHL